MKKPDKRKLIDWNKKNNNDDERISKRLEGRTELQDASTTKNDSKPKVMAPRTTAGAPLLRLRKKIKEVYDDEEDEDETDIVCAPFFNISLIEDEEQERNKEREEAEKIMRITKQQQLAGKLNIIMNTAASAENIGLSGKLTKEDEREVYSAEYNPEKLRRKTVHKKIEEPLGIQGEINEDNFNASLQGIKKAQAELPVDSLNGMPAENLPELNELDEKDMAELILKKSGRKAPKKSLVEIAKGINRYENYEQNQTNQKNSKQND